MEVIKKAAAFLLVAAFAWAGETGVDGGLMKDVWAALKTASPPVAMVLFLLFLDERRERREAQRQCNDRTLDFIKSTNAANNAFGRLASGLKQHRGNR